MPAMNNLKQQGQGGLGEHGAFALGAVLPQPGITVYGGPLFTGVSDPLAIVTSIATSSNTSESISAILDNVYSSPGTVSSSNTISTAHLGSASDINSGPPSSAELSVGAIVAISLGIVLSILSISVGIWYANRKASSKKPKRISQEMVDAPFEMESFPSDVERHRITEFMAREKRDIQLPPRRLPPTKVSNRHLPVTASPRRDSITDVNAGVYVRLHEDGGPIPPFPNQTEHSIIDVPPTYSTIRHTRIV